MAVAATWAAVYTFRGEGADTGGVGEAVASPPPGEKRRRSGGGGARSPVPASAPTTATATEVALTQRFAGAVFAGEVGERSRGGAVTELLLVQVPQAALLAALPAPLQRKKFGR